MTISKAERIYNAYVEALKEDLGEAFEAPPKFVDLPDKGQAWFAVYNATDSICANVKTEDPYEYPLTVPIEPQRIGDRFVQQDGSAPPNADEIIPETLPTALKIRPLVAGDLCLPEYAGKQGEYNVAIRARAMEIDRDMLEWRVDPTDYETAKWLLAEASGDDAAIEMRVRFEAAGGKRLVEDDIAAWNAAALELLADEHDNYYLLRTRTPGLGTVKVGPLRVGHTRIYDDVKAEQTEWDARLEALASATKKPLEALMAARIEDVDRLWSCFALLKKKSETTALLRFGARLSSRSTDGGGPTSSASVSTSSS